MQDGVILLMSQIALTIKSGILKHRSSVHTESDDVEYIQSFIPDEIVVLLLVNDCERGCSGITQQHNA